MGNPFSLSFGKQPIEQVSRPLYLNSIIETFSDEHPSNQVYMITGVRGVGKTVLMTTVSKELEKDKKWIIIPLNPERDLLQGLAAKLYDNEIMAPLFLKAKIDLSLLGIGISIENAIPVSDVEVAIERMLQIVKKHGKRILVTIDEVVTNSFIKQFVSAFQIFIRQDYPLFLIMTGLYDNINKLQNEKSLTFLYRALKIEVGPLNMTLVASKYEELFHVSSEKAREMATYTKGYSFAFQVLGYLMWNRNAKNVEEVLTEYDNYLEEYSYDKIWSELSKMDTNVLRAMAELGDFAVKVQDVRNQMRCSSNQFTGYRDRLLKKGIICSDNYGYLSFVLPRFREYVLRK